MDSEALADVLTFREQDLSLHGIIQWVGYPTDRFAIILGFVSSVLAFLGVLYAILSKVWVGQTVPGWASTVTIVSFLFAILFFFLGILGEYIGRILVEVRGRPRYLISETAETDSAAGGESRRTERGASS